MRKQNLGQTTAIVAQDSFTSYKAAADYLFIYQLLALLKIRLNWELVLSCIDAAQHLFNRLGIHYSIIN